MGAAGIEGTSETQTLRNRLEKNRKMLIYFGILAELYRVYFDIFVFC